MSVFLSKRFQAHFSLILVNLMYGGNYLVAKGLMPDLIPGSALALLRVCCTAVFFIFVLLYTAEKIEKQDWARLVICGVFGIGLNPVCSMNGLSLTSPVDAAVIMTGTPLATVLFSYFILKEPLTPQRIVGLVLGAAGAVLLVYTATASTNGASTLTGNLLICGSALSFAFYIVFVKPLMQKYNVLTIISWVFVLAL